MGCDQLRPGLDGKEGVSGSSPEEGLVKRPAYRGSWFSAMTPAPCRRTLFGHGLFALSPLPSGAAGEGVVDEQDRHPRDVLRDLLAVVARAVVTELAGPAAQKSCVLLLHRGDVLDHELERATAAAQASGAKPRPTSTRAIKACPLSEGCVWSAPRRSPDGFSPLVPLNALDTSAHPNLCALALRQSSAFHVAMNIAVMRSCDGVRRASPIQSL